MSRSNVTRCRGGATETTNNSARSKTLLSSGVAKWPRNADSRNFHLNMLVQLTKAFFCRLYIMLISTASVMEYTYRYTAAACKSTKLKFCIYSQSFSLTVQCPFLKHHRATFGTPNSSNTCRGPKLSHSSSRPLSANQTEPNIPAEFALAFPTADFLRGTTMSDDSHKITL